MNVSPRKYSSGRRTGFTLVELLVVIGIIALLISLLLPSLAGARLKATQVKCLANLHQIGVFMTLYSAENHGLLIPLGPLEDGVGSDPPPPGGTAVPPYPYQTLGSEVYPWQRWPVAIIKYSYPAMPVPPFNGPILEAPAGDPQTQPWTSPIMVCPADPSPGLDHSYLFNQHLVQNQAKVLKYSGKVLQRTSGEIVVLGEKRSKFSDYYMEEGEFANDPTTRATTHVELYRHGVKNGSNYLYLDMHAGTAPPTALSLDVDPWDITPTTTGGTGETNTAP